jgi:primosomal protein N' (replication factor Y)
MGKSDLFARVILPLAVEGTYTYSIPGVLREEISPGSRVLVGFGKKRIYSAIVHSLESHPPEGITPRPVLGLLDPGPMVTSRQLRLWEWMSSYYMCTMGEVMRAALPSGLRPESESRIRVNQSFDGVSRLDNQERLLYEVVKDEGEVTPGELEMAGVGKNPMGILKHLVEKGAVEINEFVRTIISPKTVSYVSLSHEYNTEDALHRLLDRLSGAPRQKAVLERYLELAGMEGQEVPRSQLVTDRGASGGLRTLLKKGMLHQVEREELSSSAGWDREHSRDPFQLSIEQDAALEAVRDQFREHQAVLLHGVTSSGKTELYIHLIREMLDRNRQVLYLLPEIALTTQIIERMRQVFGNRVGVYHSRYSDSERVHVYRNLLGLTDEQPYGLVIGVRSAIFLPFRDPGLVIIDEEHEITYKQQDPAPRYHARDSAQVLALYHDAKVLLGTATPSFETLFNARSGKFGYATMPSRFGEVEKPELIVANIREAIKRKQMVSHFTPRLMEEINRALEHKEQVILFQNRRGYSNYIFCRDCGYIPKCGRCDVSLTFHKQSGKLECHYCGHREAMPGMCPSCGGTNLSMKGFGTEKIEDEISLVVEGIRVARLDTDSVRSGKGHEKVIRSFEKGELDMLVGTQMITKGLDFGNVGLVGVLDADSMLNFPDFRAFERSFQLISQVSGRAGRRKKRGRVVIQTIDPEHPVIRYLLNDDYEGFYREQMEERQLFGYPPFKRLIRISFRHRVPSILDGAAGVTGRELRKIFSYRVYGPQYPPVRKVHNAYIKQIILKIEREASYEKARTLLKEVLDGVAGNEVFRSVRISVDVDPY